MDSKKTYFSPGKLLITSEYVVLDGAKALALPTKKGQHLSVSPSENLYTTWTARNADDTIWFECTFNPVSFEVLSTSNIEKSDNLLQILTFAKKITTDSSISKPLDIETKLDFPTNWGLGSSSTLLCNIAKWLNVDAYKLHFGTNNGSGYDIACGMESTPLIYSLIESNAKSEKINFYPKYKNNIFFVHLNQKQISSKEVSKYSEIKKNIDISNHINVFNNFTEILRVSESLKDFEEILLSHEAILSHILQRETIQESLFQLYKGGIIKSLGAWGGDFVMVTVDCISDLDYFKEKGYTTILSYNDMILQ